MLGAEGDPCDDEGDPSEAERDPGDDGTVMLCGVAVRGCPRVGGAEGTAGAECVAGAEGPAGAEGAAGAEWVAGAEGAAGVEGPVCATGAARSAGADGVGSVAAGVNTEGAGSGCRGPVNVCPGLTAGGVGRAGIGIPRGATGGTNGPPLDKGGRSGDATRGVGTGSSALSAAAFSGILIAAGFGASSATAARGGADVSTGAEEATGVTGASCSVSCTSSVSGIGLGRELSPECSLATRSRIASATSSSSELEWVFLSWTPNSGSTSRITVGFTSSSRASSLIRILLITEIVVNIGVHERILAILPFPPQAHRHLAKTPEFLS